MALKVGLSLLFLLLGAFAVSAEVEEDISITHVLVSWPQKWGLKKPRSKHFTIHMYCSYQERLLLILGVRLAFKVPIVLIDRFQNQTL